MAKLHLMDLRRKLPVAALAACLAGTPILPGVSHAAYPVSRQVQLAIQLLARKDYAGAVAAADKALEANPDDLVARATRGNAFTEMGDYRNALSDQDAVVARLPDDPGALINACWVRALANTDLVRAREYCDTALAKRHSLAGYDTRGFLNFREGNLEAAVADYDKALQLRPKTASPLFARGVAKIRMGKLSEGQADIAAATRLEPDVSEAYARRGVRP